MFITFIWRESGLRFFYLGLSSDFMLKKREDLVDFFKHNFLHLIKQKLKPKSKISDTSPSIIVLSIGV